MTDYVIPLPVTPSVAVAGQSARFPVRRILCIGRNYAAHSREMGKDPDREPPFYFTKPADSVVDDGAKVAYPPLTSNLHHEGELVVAIAAQGCNIAEAEALALVWGYACGNDLTRRDLQLVARDKGRPWDEGKAFDHSAVCGALHSVAEVGHPDQGTLRVTVNGEERQRGDLKELIWSVPEIISILSHSITLLPGDLIFTGTPAGVGPLVPGDVCTVAIDGLSSVTTNIVAREA